MKKMVGFGFGCQSNQLIICNIIIDFVCDQLTDTQITCDTCHCFAVVLGSATGMNPKVRFCLRTLVTFLSSVTFCVFYLPFPKDDISARRLDEYDFSEHSHEGEEWLWQTWVMAILVAIVCGGGQLCCLIHCIRAGFLRGDFQSNAGGIYTPLKQEELALHQYKPDHEKIGHVLRREMRFMLLFPIIPVLAINQTSCEKGMPWWGYLLYLPLLVRAKWIEVKIMQALNEDLKSIFSTPGFWLGCLEHADWFTDGALPVQAYLCGPSVTNHFAESFELSWAWPLAPVVRTLHFWGSLA